MHSVTRRQFLASLAPFSVTAVRVVAALKMAGFCSAAVFVFSILKSIGFATSVRLAVSAALLFAVLCCLASVFVWLDSIFRRMSPFLAAPAMTVFELASFILVLSYGVYLYRRWEAGADLAGPAIALGSFYIMRFIGEYHRRANQALEPTSPAGTDRAGARSAPAGDVAHL